MVEFERPPSDPSSGPSDRRRWVLVAIVGLAGLLTGWVYGSTAGPSTTSTATADDDLIGDDAAFSTTSSASSTTHPAAAPTGDAPSRGRVELLPASLDLRGSVALAVPGPVGDQNLWLIEPGGRMLQRVEAHIRPSGQRHPMMIVGDYLLTTTGRGTFRMEIDLVDPALRVEEPGFLIPDAGSNRSWLVGGDPPEWVAPFDGETGEVGERTELLPGSGWPFAGYDDGVLLQPRDVALYGRVAFWPRRGEPIPLGVDLDVDSAIHSVVGRTAVMVSPGPRLTMVDLPTGARSSTIDFDPDDGNVVGACLSGDAAYVAGVGSTGVVEVFETATGQSRGRITTADPPWSLGWAAPNQLVSIAPIEGASALSLQLFDVEAGLVTSIARLEAPGIWRMATGGRPC